MAVALSTVPTGSFFSIGVSPVPIQKYVLSAETGTDASHLVVYNITRAVIEQLVNTTMVDVLTLTVAENPVFSI